MASQDLTLTSIEGEPRIHDLLLAKRLGFDQPRDIRKLIKRNEAKLLNFGRCATVARRYDNGGTPTDEYYLNQKQSIFIVMKSETDNAFEVQADIVRVYDAHLNGAVPSARRALPSDFPTALRAYADEVERREQAERELESSRPKIAFHDQVVASEDLIDMAQTFSLLQTRTGQKFGLKTWLEFMRRHGIANQPNQYRGIGRDRFVPRNAYIGTWFVSHLTPTGAVEWLLRPIAIAGIVALIEQDRRAAPLPCRALAYAGGAA